MSSRTKEHHQHEFSVQYENFEHSKRGLPSLNTMLTTAELQLLRNQVSVLHNAPLLQHGLDSDSFLRQLFLSIKCVIRICSTYHYFHALGNGHNKPRFHNNNDKNSNVDCVGLGFIITSAELQLRIDTPTTGGGMKKNILETRWYNPE